MFCKECGSEIKEGELFCGNCGSPINESEPVIMQMDNRKEQAGVSFKDFIGNKNFLIGLGIVGVFILVIVLMAKPIMHVFAKTFYSPEKYFAYIETNSAEKSAETLSSFYDIFLEGVKIDGTKRNAEVQLSLTEDGYKIIDALTIEDLDWLNNVKLSGSLSTKNNAMSGDFGLTLDKNKLVTGNIIMDFEDESIYMQFPELSDKYIATDEVDMDGDEITDTLNAYGQLINSMPDKSTVAKLYNKYYGIAMSKLTDVKKSKDTLKVEGVSQNCIKLEATMDDEYFYEVTKAVLEELLKDKDFKKVIQNMAKSLEAYDVIDYDKDEVYEEFCDAIEDALDDIDEDDFYYYDMTYTIWVNSSGEVIGRCIEDEWSEVAWLMPRKGNNVGTEFYSEIKYEGITEEYIGIVGTGKYSGNKLSGTYYMEYQDYYSSGKEEMLEITVDKFDTSALQKGNILGNFKFALSEKYCKEYGLPRLAQNLYIALDTNIKANNLKYGITIGNDDEVYGTFSVSTEIESVNKINIPADKKVIFVEDEDDAEEWLSTVKFDNLLKNLEKTNIPDDYLDVIEDIIDEIEDYY